MIVSPELISASSAPSARPLNSCETKLGQVSMAWGGIGDAAGWGSDGAPAALSTSLPAPDLHYVSGARSGTGQRRRPASGIIAEVATERIGRLHQRGAWHDLGDLPEILLVAHLARLLAANDDDRPHQLVVRGAEVHIADRRFDVLAGLISL